MSAESFWILFLLDLLRLTEVWVRKYGYVNLSKKLITREATHVSLGVEFPQTYPGIWWRHFLWHFPYMLETERRDHSFGWFQHVWTILKSTVSVTHRFYFLQYRFCMYTHSPHMILTRWPWIITLSIIAFRQSHLQRTWFQLVWDDGLASLIRTQIFWIIWIWFIWSIWLKFQLLKNLSIFTPQIWSWNGGSNTSTPGSAANRSPRTRRCRRWFGWWTRRLGKIWKTHKNRWSSWHVAGKNGNLGTYWEPHGKQYGQNLGCGDLTKQQNEDWENMFSAPKPAPNQGRQRFDRLRRVPALLCGAPTVPGTMMWGQWEQVNYPIMFNIFKITRIDFVAGKPWQTMVNHGKPNATVTIHHDEALPQLRPASQGRGSRRGEQMFEAVLDNRRYSDTAWPEQCTQECKNGRMAPTVTLIRTPLNKWRRHRVFLHSSSLLTFWP